MPFIKRLGFFLVGLSIGLVFLAFFLKKKTAETGTQFCYFPNCRVLKDLRSKPLLYTDAATAQINSKNLDSTDIAYFLHEGTVDFKKSDTKTEPCKTFVIEATLKEKEMFMTVSNCKDKVVIEKISG